MVLNNLAGPSSVPSSLPRWLKSHLSAAGHWLHSWQRFLPLSTPDGPHLSENGNTFRKPHGVRKSSTGWTKLFHSSLFWQIFNSLSLSLPCFHTQDLEQFHLSGLPRWSIELASKIRQGEKEEKVMQFNTVNNFLTIVLCMQDKSGR